MDVTRRVRGTIGMMSIWAGVFAIVGAASLCVFLMSGRAPQFLNEHFFSILRIVVIRSAVLGATAGLAFSASVLLAERKRTLERLSTRRFASWGFLAGAVVTIGVLANQSLMYHIPVEMSLRRGLVPLALWSAVGAGIAAISLRAARRSPALANDFLANENFLEQETQ